MFLWDNIIIVLNFMALMCLCIRLYLTQQRGEFMAEGASTKQAIESNTKRPSQINKTIEM